MRYIKGQEGKYSISEDGRVWSHPRKYVKTGRYIKPFLGTHGYYSVNLGHSDHRLIHRLLAETFIDNPLRLPWINHINGIKTDNRLDNIEWCNPSENNYHAINMGLRKAPRKITKSECDLIFMFRKNGLSQTQISKKFNVGRATIQRVLNGTHGYGMIRNA